MPLTATQVLERRERLIDAIAHFIVDNVADKSIRLQMNQHAIYHEWAKIHQASGCFGYPTLDEARAKIRETLGVV